MKKFMFVMPLMAAALLASCNNGGGNTPVTTYTITFDCDNCKAYDENDNEITTIDVSTDASYTTYRKFYLKGSDGYHQPLNNLISVKKTSGKEPVTDYSYKGTDGSIILPIVSDLTITAQGFKNKTLEECSWKEIQEISKEGRAREFFDIYDPTKPELNCKKVQLKHQDLDNDGEIDENEVYQTVRIIGFDTDYTDPNDRENTKVGITFEFADVICDAYGYSLGLIWNHIHPDYHPNYRYDTSTMRHALNDELSGTAFWCDKYEEGKSTTYKDSVLNMLPNDLVNAITPVSKNININEGDGYKETPIKDSLFLLALKEMGHTNEEGTDPSEVDVPTYEYYKDCPLREAPKRIKAQIKGAEGAIGSKIIYNSDFVTGMCFVHAGYNIKSGENDSCNYWLRSIRYSNPTAPDENVYLVYSSNINNYSAFNTALPVAPAFCI